LMSFAMNGTNASAATATNSSDVEWGDITCCNDQQWFFIFTVSFYVAAGYILWHSILLKPFKLFTVFLHELCHALAAWCCCGKVTGIEVQLNEGGLTHWSIAQDRMWCARHWVLPAGYLGSTVWGCAILIGSADAAGCQTMACLVVAACIVTFFYAACGQNTDGERLTLMILCVIFGAWLGALAAASWSDTWEHANLGLEASLLLIAALNVLYASYDIYDDTIRRSDERSDAFQCATMYPCFFPKCVGLVWFLLSLAFVAASVLVFMMITTYNDGPPRTVDSLGDEGYAAFVPGPAVFLFAVGLKILDVVCLSKYRAQINVRFS